MTTPDDTTGKRENDMSDENQFPPEVWGSALELWAILETNRKSDMRELADALLAERGRATAAERERCAAKAERLGKMFEEDDHYAQFSACETVAAAIRATP